MSEEVTEYKKYSQEMNGQFAVKSKKAQALFIGRSIQLLGDSVKTFEESKHLRMDTLRYMITESPVITEDGTEVAGWVHINVAYEVGSFDPYTEEDRQRDRERMEEAKKRKAKADEEEGEAAMKALEREIYPPKVEDRIQ